MHSLGTAVIKSSWRVLWHVHHSHSVWLFIAAVKVDISCEPSCLISLSSYRKTTCTDKPSKGSRLQSCRKTSACLSDLSVWVCRLRIGSREAWDRTVLWSQRTTDRKLVWGIDDRWVNLLWVGFWKQECFTLFICLLVYYFCLKSIILDRHENPWCMSLALSL